MWTDRNLYLKLHFNFAAFRSREITLQEFNETSKWVLTQLLSGANCANKEWNEWMQHFIFRCIGQFWEILRNSEEIDTDASHDKTNQWLVSLWDAIIFPKNFFRISQNWNELNASKKNQGLIPNFYW